MVGVYLDCSPRVARAEDALGIPPDDGDTVEDLLPCVDAASLGSVAPLLFAIAALSARCETAGIPALSAGSTSI